MLPSPCLTVKPDLGIKLPDVVPIPDPVPRVVVPGGRRAGGRRRAFAPARPSF